VRPGLRELAAVFAGGFVGAVLRAGVVEAFPPTVGRWPWATFAVNIFGAFLLGFAATRLGARRASLDLRLRFVGTGVCGALTTFSTLQLELLQMLDADRAGLALAYATVSAAVGYLAVALASTLARRAQVIA